MMNNRKDNQNETLIIELAACALILGIFYVIAKIIA